MTVGRRVRLRFASSRLRRGFTVFEAMIAAVLLGVGISAMMLALGALTKGEAQVVDRQTLYDLATRKYDELVATGEFRNSSEGDFSVEGQEDIEWTSTLEPSGLTDVETFRVTATRGELSQTITGLLYTGQPEETQTEAGEPQVGQP